MKSLLAFTAACLVAAGCSSTLVDSDTEARVTRHMFLADSLQRALVLDQATLEYQIVAEHYPTSSAYPTAVRKTSLLYLNPDNPSRSDSLARHWLNAYLGLPVTPQDRESARTELYLLERITALQQELIRRQNSADSLTAIIRRQDSQLSNQTQQTQQIQTLQNELKQVRQELVKLKQVDVQINQSRRK